MTFPARATTTGNPTQKEVTVTDNPTDIQPNDGTLLEHRDAFEALAELARVVPALPAPYVRMDTPEYGPVRLILSFRSPQDFEQWRAVLLVPGSEVELFSECHGVWLAADATLAGSEVHFTGHNVDLTDEQLTAPRDLTVPDVVPLHQAPAATAVNA